LNSNGDLYTQAAKGGYLIKKSDGTPYLTDFGEFNCGTVDLTNPNARKWYKGMFICVIELQFSSLYTYTYECMTD
jgi:alpha-glucosidase